MLGKAAQRSAHSSSEGLTRAELRSVADDVGLDLAQVDVALAELESRHKADARVLGFDQFVVVERTVEGTIDTAALERAKKIINRSVGIIGQSELDEHGLSWFGRHVSVSISQNHGRMAVHVEERFHNTTRAQLAMGTMFSAMGAVMTLVSLANVGAEGLGFALGALLPVLTYGGLRRLHKARVTSTRQRLEGLGDQLAALLGESQRSLGPGEDA